MATVRFVGLDVHAETITIAVAESAGEVRALGTLPNRPDAVRRLVRQLGPSDQLRLCYEADPTGYVLYWQLTASARTATSWRPRWCRRRPVIGSRPIDGTPRNWRAATAPAT